MPAAAARRAQDVEDFGAAIRSATSSPSQSSDEGNSSSDESDNLSEELACIHNAILPPSVNVTNEQLCQVRSKTDFHSYLTC